MPRSLQLALVLLATAPACVDAEPGAPVDGPHTASEVTRKIGPVVRRSAVDVLFVIDDSPSMAEEQRLLAANFASLVEVLEADDVNALYRIAVTTTDAGNPWCDEGSSERGAFVSSSCHARADDFPGVFDVGCADICDTPAVEILPTTTAYDDAPRPRPWIERTECESNVGGGVPTIEAFSCLGPQGIGGCRFESPLEAMYQSLQRMLRPGEPEYGFLRQHARLMIVFVTDGTDCSLNEAHAGIFSAISDGGSAVFWSDPDADEPTNAVCWNAGVACEGSGTPYASCSSSDKDVNGVEDVPAEDAVLHPLRRYIDLVQAIEDGKRGFAEDPEVVVSVISGVPQTYDGELVYSRSLDPVEQRDFGIGPGCTYDDGDPMTPIATARPPVREKEFAEAFEVRDAVNLYSICQESYTGAVESIAETIRDQIRPGCMTACVADIDPEAAGLQSQCTLVQDAQDAASGDFVTTDIAPCNPDGTLPDDAGVCYVALVDDALSEECFADGWNLEFRIVRRDCVHVPDGATLRATCSASLDSYVDCPYLP